MTPRSGHERLLLWYPAAWRERYGTEFLGLLEDTHEAGPIPRREQLSIALSGCRERLYDAGLADSHTDPSSQIRVGATRVVCAWSAVVLAVGSFAKFSEHWSQATPFPARFAPTVAFAVLQWAMVVSAMLVAIGAVAALPGVIAMLADGGWLRFRRTLMRNALVLSFVFILSVAFIITAHVIGPMRRNSGTWPVSLAVAFWSFSLVVAAVITMVTITRLIRQSHFTPSVIRVEAIVSLGITATIAVVTASTIIWWAVLGRVAPNILTHGLFATRTSELSPYLASIALVMSVALALALASAYRVVRTFARVA